MASLFLLQIDHGRQLGHSWKVEECNRASLLEDIISGQHDRILEVIEVSNEGWNHSIAEDLARDIAAKREPLRHDLIDFIARHAGNALANEMKEAA